MYKLRIKLFILFIVFAFYGVSSDAIASETEKGSASVNVIKQKIFRTFNQDIEYKKQILKDCGDETYTLENLNPIVGPKELEKFIKANNKNRDIYTPSEENLKNGKFIANFHIHTTNSDGSMSVEELLDTALKYADTLGEKEHLYIAVTDHNTVYGAQDVIRVLQANPGKYNKLKIVPGIEVYTEYTGDKTGKKDVGIHVLTWCINPFDLFLVKEFYKDKNDTENKWNYMSKDFDGIIRMMKEYGIVGVAHPARYSYELGDIRYEYAQEMLERYKKAGKSDKPLFIEGYYQAYPDFYDTQNDKEFIKYYNFINAKADKLGINKTGSTDTHGKSIFKH